MGALQMDTTLEDGLLPLDNDCPHCGGYCADDEVHDGQFFACASCGKRVCAVAWTGGTMSMIDAETKPARLTGRKKTRALWRRRGRWQ